MTEVWRGLECRYRSNGRTSSRGSAGIEVEGQTKFSGWLLWLLWLPWLPSRVCAFVNRTCLKAVQRECKIQTVSGAFLFPDQKSLRNLGSSILWSRDMGGWMHDAVGAELGDDSPVFVRQ